MVSKGCRRRFLNAFTAVLILISTKRKDGVVWFFQLWSFNLWRCCLRAAIGGWLNAVDHPVGGTRRSFLALGDVYFSRPGIVCLRLPLRLPKVDAAQNGYWIGTHGKWHSEPSMASP